MFRIEKKEKLIEWATNLIKEELQNNKNPVLLLPTGNAPLEIYANLIKLNQNKLISFRNVTTFNLDEYVQDENNPTKLSLKEYMKNKLFNYIDILETNTNFPTNIDQYNNKLDMINKINITFLGLGENGHVAFNEPGSEMIRTHKAKLTFETRVGIGKKYNLEINQVPNEAFTTGLKDIYEKSELIVLLAWGESKKIPLLKLKEAITKKEIDKKWPVTNFITHKNFIVLTDQKI